ncbi:GNAT family N-acetyltransferase [Pseudonocardia sp. GCM10023141]|uniref:GNAT family N-acetyltransferase n=1 Tax=Pseudonocardia sp. GCM10023141 TaxID=3252653 RepID=UPI00361B5526
MTAEPDVASLLTAYDAQLRAQPRADETEWDGPLRRSAGAGGGFVGYRDLGGLDGPELDELIARQVLFFAERGLRFEWKHHSHDLPTDLPLRLLAAGFVPEDRETVLIGGAAGLADADPPLAPQVSLRRTSDPADFARIEALNTAVWGGDMSWLAGMLAAESAAEGFEVWVAEVDGELASAAWLRPRPGTDFAGLWGGSTLEAFRGRGIYRALVAVRAAAAVRDGYRYLQVDASEDSRPILQRRGFVAITHTTPYIWTPPA